MKTPHSNEDLLALCALIVEEKDQSKFVLLVQELRCLLENRNDGSHFAPGLTHGAQTLSERKDKTLKLF